MTRLFKMLAAISMSGLLAACGGSDSESSLPIDQVAQQRGFTALGAAVTKAGLGNVLSAPNSQLTVFAPTDAAFNSLATTLGFTNATAMVEALPASALRSILSYHVLSGNKSAAELIAGGSSQSTIYSFEGQPAALSVNTGSGGVRVTDAVLVPANVTNADIQASNGVIHAVDKVLVPPGVLNIVQMAQLNPQFSSLVGALAATNLQATLAGPGPLTVFAPTNAAFAAAPTGLTPQQLSTVLTYHVLGSRVLASEIPFGSPINTVANQQIVIENGTPPTIRDTTASPARITATNVRASNGVIHVIDKVLIPAL